MDANLTDLAAPTVVAAVVSGAALLVRELLSTRGERNKLHAERRRHEDDFALRGQELLLKQIDSLWRENAAGRAREAESRQRCRELERQCLQLEQRCRDLETTLKHLQQRLDRVDPTSTVRAPANSSANVNPPAGSAEKETGDVHAA